MLPQLYLIKSFILASILFMSPMHKFPLENPNERIMRLDAIAQDIVSVAFDPSETPIFDGENSRLKTALFLASTANNESGFSAGIDSGRVRGDFGKSVCLMQIMTNQGRNMNYTAKWLLADRKNCLRAGLRMIRLHFCGGWGIVGSMRSYMSGSCRHRSNPVDEKTVANASWNETIGYRSVVQFFDKRGWPKEVLEDNYTSFAFNK